MTKSLSVLISLPEEKMNVINKYADDLGVTTGHLASCLLNNSVGIEALPRVYLKEPTLCIKEDPSSRHRN
ncbi:hypothetical protein LCGC14_2583940 [marine sediment metagenome]|uniref:CopG family transcriptional regulator n=1 Tax=marine sediment metagenome TaxID=412755 RepID=A0A0F9D6C4_9ZZZZ